MSTGTNWPARRKRGGDLEAVNARQHHVEHDGVEALPPAEEHVERRLAVGHRLDAVALGFEVEAQAVGEVLLVLDYQHRRAHLWSPLGRRIVNVLPRPGPSLSAKTCPPCFFTTERTMKRPRPVPLTRAMTRPGAR